MRNILAHKYGKIGDSLVFEALKKELLEDVHKFLDFISKKKLSPIYLTQALSTRIFLAISSMIFFTNRSPVKS